jgi:hypothetical protein
VSALHFDEATHTYTVGGRVVPSVTQILASVDRDLWRVPPGVLEAAAALGTAVHKATELDDLADLDEESLAPQIAPYLAAWRRFRAETGFAPVAIEERLHNAMYGYCGTLDRVGHLDGQRALLDIKSGMQWPSHGPQTAAYQDAYERQSGKKIDLRLVVYLRDDGTYRMVAQRDKSDWSVFLAALTIHKFTTKEQ